MVAGLATLKSGEESRFKGEEACARGDRCLSRRAVSVSRVVSERSELFGVGDNAECADKARSNSFCTQCR